MGDAAASLAVRLERAGAAGLHEADLLRAVRSIEGIDGVRLGRDLWLHRDVFESLRQRAVEAVEAHHRDRPLDPWVGLAAVSSQLSQGIADTTARAALECCKTVNCFAKSRPTAGIRVPGWQSVTAQESMYRCFPRYP